MASKPSAPKAPSTATKGAKPIRITPGPVQSAHVVSGKRGSKSPLC